MTLTIFAYLAILIFIAVLLYRVIRIASQPLHLRWDLYPVPHEAGGKAKYGGSYFEESNWWLKSMKVNKLGELSVMIPEILLLKGVWESNRSLWFWSWSFHTGLYAMILTAATVIASLVFGPMTSFGQVLVSIGGIAAVFGFVLGTIGCFGMLVKRLFDEHLRPFTSIAAMFNLLFILFLFVSGLVAVIESGRADFIAQLHGFVTALINFSSTEMILPFVKVHIIACLLFAAYLPFTHMSHVVLKYFTYHDIRWNDQPNFKGSKIDRKINEYLGLKPTWAADHWKADGKKTWADIATEEVFKDE
jgi:nitrate reductase gamma subunit